MRMLLLAGVAALAFQATPARAQWAVIDAANLAQSVEQVTQAINTIKVLRSTFDAVAHVTDIGEAMSAVGGISRRVLPLGSEISGLMSGSRGLFGSAGQRLQSDRVYTPAEADEWSEEMARRETVTANARAMAEAGMEDCDVVLEALQTLARLVGMAPDGTAGTAIQSAINLVRGRVQVANTTMSQISSMVALDNRVTQQRGEQRWRRDVDAYIDKTSPALEGW